MPGTSPLEAAIERLKKSDVSPDNIRFILEHDKKLAGERISEERRKKFIDRLRWWAETIKVGFDKAGREQLAAAYEKLKARKELKPLTINIYITMLRQFYKHLEGEDDFFPEKVRKLKPLAYQPDLVSEDGETSIRIYKVADIQKMIDAARTARERCLVALSLDCGGRLGEVLALNMGHLKKEPPFFKVYLHGDKTWKRARVGKRWVAVYYAVPFINDYLRNHPFKLGDADKPFWVAEKKFDSKGSGRTSDQISPAGFKKLFDRLKKKAGITGRRFHDLRHTKCTHLLRLGMSEMKVKKFMGWSMNSKQLGRYAHLVQEDVDEELSRLYGLPYERKKHDDIPIPLKCPICGEVNEADAGICSKCQNPLTAKAITNATTRERYWQSKYNSSVGKVQKQLEAMHTEQEKMRAEMKRMAASAAREAVSTARKETERRAQKKR